MTSNKNLSDSEYEQIANYFYSKNVDIALTVPAPAKLNLFLLVNGCRSDGYHLLQTMFQLLSWSDWLIFAPSSTIKITTDSSTLKTEPVNLIEVAIHRLLDHAPGLKKGIHIHLLKKIPLGGGLGGGSSDAATTLMILNLLWGLHFSQSKLMEIATTIGADVPVFVFEKSAFAMGIGDQLTSIVLKTNWYLVIETHIPISTTLMFHSSSLKRNSRILSVEETTKQQYSNAFEPVVFEHYPAMKRLFDTVEALTNGRYSLHLTGTGGCCFIPLLTYEEAKNLRSLFTEKMPMFSYHITVGINDSSVYKVFDQLVSYHLTMNKK